MKSGTCPKCKTPTVYRKLNGISDGGASGAVYVTTSWFTTASPVECYICTRCGYFERYVVDEKKMSEITSAWEKVG